MVNALAFSFTGFGCPTVSNTLPTWFHRTFLSVFISKENMLSPQYYTLRESDIH